MTRLLNAGVMRLRKNKLFWVLSIFSIGLAIFMIYENYKGMKLYGDVVEIEQDLLNYAQLIGIVASIFTSLFLGVEYSDGGIRNKISIGNKRGLIYLSNLIIVTITNILSYALFCLVILLLGIPIFGSITMPIIELLKLVGTIIIIILSYSAIFTFIAMLNQNKTITAVVSIIISFGLLMFALTCFNVLNAPEYIKVASITNEETGDFEMVKEKNPKYPSTTKRKVYQTLIDINPAGQSLQISGRLNPNLKILVLYSLGILIIFTSTGIFLFNKKELK